MKNKPNILTKDSA